MREGLFVKYIKTYLFILGGSLLLLIPVYIAIYKGTEELVLTESYNSLKQDVTYLDNQINKMNIITDLLRSNEQVRNLAQIYGSPRQQDAMDMLKVKEFLKSCFTLRVESFDEYLVFRNNPVIIAKGEILSEPQYQSYEAYGQKGTDFAIFRQNIFEDEMKIQYMTMAEGDKESGIIGSLKILSNARFHYETALVFTLNQETIHEILGLEEECQTKFAYIMDGNGEILYQVNYSGEPLKKDAYERQIIKRNGNKYTVFQVQAENSNLYWTLGISDETIRQKITDVNRIISIYMIAAILGVVLFCAFWAISRAKNMGGVLEELDNLRKSTADSILEKLLLRGVYSSREKEEIENYLCWDMEFYCVVCSSTRLKQDGEILECFCQMDEFFRKHFTCISISIGNNERNYIIEMKKEDMPDVGVISDALKELVSDQIELYFGISSIGTGLENIQLCYQQAKLMNRQIAGGYDMQIKAYREPIDNREKIFKLNLGNRMYDLIHAEEKDAIKTLFDKIRSYAAKNSWYTEAEIMQFFFEIQSPIARIWDEMEQNSNKKVSLGYRTDKTIIELVDSLEEASYYLCDCIGKNKEKSKNAFYQEMIRFVEENYSSKDMCITYVAQHLGISDKSFAALFKEQTGKNFGTYVEKRRMKQVEKYLLETDFSMTKIADMVGYNTLDAFYKSFKKIYGLAPGKWKENNMNK